MNIESEGEPERARDVKPERRDTRPQGRERGGAVSSLLRLPVPATVRQQIHLLDPALYRMRLIFTSIAFFLVFTPLPLRYSLEWHFTAFVSKHRSIQNKSPIKSHESKH